CIPPFVGRLTTGLFPAPTSFVQRAAGISAKERLSNCYSANLSLPSAPERFSPAACPDVPRPAHDGVPPTPAPPASAPHTGRPERTVFERDCPSPSACPDAPRPAHAGIPPAPAPEASAPHRGRPELTELQRDCSSPSSALRRRSESPFREISVFGVW